MDKSQHITNSSSENTVGTALDVIPRPNLNIDPRCEEILRLLIESFIVVFPKEIQNAIEDSIVRAIQQDDGRFSNLNLAKYSADVGNIAKAGSDDGIYVAKPTFQSSTATAQSNLFGSHTMPLSGFTDTNYQVGVEPLGDPGVNFRWWVTNKSPVSVTVEYAASETVKLLVTAH